MKFSATFPVILAGLALPTVAGATSLIKSEGAHPRYVAELEPHLGIGFRHPGIGVRGTFDVAEHGFINGVNDSVGVGVGLDFPVAGRSGVLVPVVMQWNFWFTEHWSAFGEPGLALGSRHLHAPVPLHLAVGGRYNFNESIALTLRLGFPFSSFGVSFFL